MREVMRSKNSEIDVIALIYIYIYDTYTIYTYHMYAHMCTMYTSYVYDSVNLGYCGIRSHRVLRCSHGYGENIFWKHSGPVQRANPG